MSGTCALSVLSRSPARLKVRNTKKAKKVRWKHLRWGTLIVKKKINRLNTKPRRLLLIPLETKFVCLLQTRKKGWGWSRILGELLSKVNLLRLIHLAGSKWNRPKSSTGTASHPNFPISFLARFAWITWELHENTTEWNANSKNRIYFRLFNFHPTRNSTARCVSVRFPPDLSALSYFRLCPKKKKKVLPR